MSKKNFKEFKPNGTWLLLPDPTTKKTDSGIYLDEDTARKAATNAGINQIAMSVNNGDLKGWKNHVNRYLIMLGSSPINLNVSSNTFDFNDISGFPLERIQNGPLISVLLPVWNSENTIYSASKSILDQTFTNIELIIVDDASTDSTWSILKRIKSERKL